MNKVSYEQSLVLIVKKNIIGINLYQSNNRCLYFLKNEDLVRIKLL